MFDICIFFGFFSVIDVNWLEIWVLVREMGVGVCVCVCERARVLAFWFYLSVLVCVCYRFFRMVLKRLIVQKAVKKSKSTHEGSILARTRRIRSTGHKSCLLGFYPDPEETF